MCAGLAESYAAGSAINRRFAVCRERERSPDVLALKIGKIGEDLVLAHASSEVIQDVVDSNAKTPDAGFSAPLSRLYRNSLAVVHS